MVSNFSKMFTSNFDWALIFFSTMGLSHSTTKNQKFIYKKPRLNVGVFLEPPGATPTSPPSEALHGVIAVFSVRVGTAYKWSPWSEDWHLAIVWKPCSCHREYQQLHYHNHELELCMYVMCVCWTKRKIGRLVLGSLSWWNGFLQLAFQESHNLFWYGWCLVS